ncbi:UDP-glucose 4-epimerase [Paenibacillus albidus]|uniref:UDP-glucose 4-epimerase n=1 Tax=Paenibacillus albidus TaxID=2041023 RepID=A0A917F937_9BACL|nr:NAD-dependent epimerase/dehydratase family protein [Paenibacillus albidus]GGF58943.1 UDP-glucose 4-epimerase [Paenibacillus albidus]
MDKKKILITGKGSYIGTSFINWVKQWPEQYEVEELSVRGEAWKEHDFSQYKAIIHVAAVVHKKEKPENEQLYFRVNKDLAISIAKKAQQDGVGQFLFMSSMSVYGLEGLIGQDTVIYDYTECKPTSFYGKSKLAAEEEILKMDCEEFKIAIIRAPMIYGYNCPGNYTRLRKIALKSPLFPSIENKRSMIFIDNLSEFIRWLLLSRKNGIFFPQNKEYISTVELVKLVSSINNRRLLFSKFFAIPIKLLGNQFDITKKIFGNLKYDLRISLHDEYNYSLANLKDSIQKSEIDGA